ncbi:MAG: hypothetical protein WBX25_27815 [Rhodomicrobium sp.]
MANQRNWNWYGTNSIWFLENENGADYLSTDSALVFLLVSWSEITQEKTPRPMVKLSADYFKQTQLTLEKRTCYINLKPFPCNDLRGSLADASKQLYEQTKSFSEELGKGGMAIQIRLPNRLEVLDKDWQHFYTLGFRKIEFTPETAYTEKKATVAPDGNGWGKPGVWNHGGVIRRMR